MGRVVLGRVLCGASCLGASCLWGELSVILFDLGRFDIVPCHFVPVARRFVPVELYD